MWLTVENASNVEMTFREAHDRPGADGHDAESHQDIANGRPSRPNRVGENCPVDASDGVDAELDHDARKEDANGSRRHGVRVRQPEMKRRQGRFNAETADNKR